MSEPNYSIEKFEGYMVIKLTGNLDYKNSKVFEEEIDGLSNDASHHIIIDCEHLVSLSKDWVRNFLRVQINLKATNKFFKLIHLSPAIQSYLKKEGIDSMFKVAVDLQDALDESKPQGKRTLDTEFVNPFLTATMHVLKVQAGVEVTPGKVYLKKLEDKNYGDVSGIIGIISDAFNGSVVISFPEKTFLKVMSSMLGEEYTKLDKEIIDGAGELTNMIFGQAKVVLNDKGYGIKTAIPSVITGKDHSTLGVTKGPIVVVPFESPAGAFFVEICLSA